MNIELKLKEQILKLSKNKISQDEIDDNTDFIENLGFDSVLIVQMITELEDVFSIIFEDDDMDLEILTNFKNLKGLIKSKVISTLL